MYHVAYAYSHSPAVSNFLKKGITTIFLQMYYHVLKLLYLLAGVALADPAVGHCAVFGGCEVVESIVVTVTVTGFLRQRQSGVARTGVVLTPHRNMEVVVLLRLLVYLKLPVACCLEFSTRLFWDLFFPVQPCITRLTGHMKGFDV